MEADIGFPSNDYGAGTRKSEVPGNLVTTGTVLAGLSRKIRLLVVLEAAMSSGTVSLGFRVLLPRMASTWLLCLRALIDLSVTFASFNVVDEIFSKSSFL